jgi:hypothetical protein
VSEAIAAKSTWLYRPANAIRIDNDFFVGTPLPPEEPTAENPPAGATIDYFLKNPAASVKLEIFDAQQNLVRRFSSEESSVAKHASLPVAERWFPKPEALEKTSGMHRFVWNLTWVSSGGPNVDDDADFNNPSGPKVVPGSYQLRLTVDGEVQSQTLGRRALAEIGSVQKQLADVQKRATQNARLTTALAAAQSRLTEILGNQENGNKENTPEQGPGLQEAYEGVASALRVVEGGDRAVPSQAIDVYKELSPQVDKHIAEWAAFKQKDLPELSRQLRDANLAPIAITEIEQQVEFLMSR